MGDLFRVHQDKSMSPPTGIGPIDGRWGGEMPTEYVEAIFNDVQADIPGLVEGGIPPEELLESVIVQSIMRTAQRLVVELEGCVIGNTTSLGELGADLE